MLKRSIVVAGMTLALGAALPAASNAVELCFSLGGFGNQFRLELTAMSATNFLITGQENVFADRAVSGTAVIGVNQPNTLRLGFTNHSGTAAGATNATYNAELSLVAPFTGSYAAWRDKVGDEISGSFDLISCAGVPLTGSDLPDAHD